MDIDILKIGTDPILQFEVIARKGSLKAAAAELNLSQPAITHALNKLESNLGIQLCIRNRSQFALTETGKRLFETAKDIKARLKGFESSLLSGDSFDGIFNVGILGHISNPAFEKNLHLLVRKFPSLKLCIQAYPAERILELVRSGELDIGFGLFKKRKDLAVYPIGEETICHYISEQHPLWKKNQISEALLKSFEVTWLDIISRDRSKLESEIFKSDRQSGYAVNSYANSLHAATIILRTGESIVPFPSGYLESRNFDFKYRKLDRYFKPYSLKQTVILNKTFAQASPASRFFMELL